MKILLLLLFTCNLSWTFFAQNYGNYNVNIRSTKPQIVFKGNEFQQYGFDDFQFSEWKSQYDNLESDHLENYFVPYKSVGYNTTDDVDAVFINKKDFDADSVQFTIDGQFKRVKFVQKNDSTFTLFLPKMTFNYSISARYKGVKFGQLNVVVYSTKIEKVIIVPLVENELNKDSLQFILNRIYAQANVRFRVSIQSSFKTKIFNEETKFDNPSPSFERFTNQMRECRDAYFERYPNADRKAYYIFVIPEFVNENLKGYMVLNKAVGFVKVDDEKSLNLTISRQLGHGIGILKNSWEDFGPEQGTTDNLMDDSYGTGLLYFQWENIRHSSHSFSYYDNYEDVKTNNGLVAYYFWKEDKNGRIILENGDLLSSLQRPYKKNFVSYHLNIGDFFFQTLFKIGGYLICLWHILAFLLILITTFIVRRKFYRFLKTKIRFPRFWKFTSSIGFFGVALALSILSFILINKGYERFEVRAGYLKDLGKMSSDQAVKSILVNENVKHKPEKKLISEILIKRGNKWYVNRRKMVLYFNLKQDKEGKWTICDFIKDKDSLNLETYQYNELAESHYIVFNYLEKNGEIADQKVLNHLGIDLTNKLKLDDPAKRILILVNGYRPTSIGHSFEENFADIKKNGLEFQNSNNMIYNFDRFDYWRPWKEMDLLFQKRINPSETYYADGHFTVNTSNYESLLNFTTLSTSYPERCKYKNKHVCYKSDISSGIFGSKTVSTYDLLPLKPNRKGFKERMMNGKIAGKNLLQLFNELPNRSDNDTLYVVAHSMGFAYSLGIIEELRGRINFGGFYIIAPENAASGKVNPREWKQVWQYGSNLNGKKGDAPCLQDGVAPQVKAGGLTNAHRAYIPPELFKQKGFFDSHFIGYYTWIFKRINGESGYIEQH